MALQSQVGQFAANTGGATTTVSCSFQGKAIIFWTHGKTANPESVVASWSMGFADSAGHVFCQGWASDNGVGTTNAGASEQTARALQILSNGTPAAATGGSISSVTFNSGNFVVTFNATPASAYLVDFILLGGSDITNVLVANTTTPGSGTGLQHITNVGFQGNFVIALMSLQTAVGVTTNSSGMMGVATSTSKRWASTGITQDGQTVGANVNAGSQMTASKLLSLMTTNNTIIFDADFTGFTATGFDYTINTSSASAYVLGYLVIQGGQWDCGTQSKPTTATTQSVTGEAFSPSLLGLFLSFPTALDTPTAHQESSFGATDGTNQVYANALELDQLPTVADSSGSVSQVLLDRDGSSNPKATFTSFNSDGWTITWDATGTAKQVSWFTGSSNSVPPTPSQIVSVVSVDVEHQWLGGDWR